MFKFQHNPQAMATNRIENERNLASKVHNFHTGLAKRVANMRWLVLPLHPVTRLSR